MTDISVVELHTYPIKSCAPAEMPTDSYVVGPYGLQYDREWLVTRPNGSFLSQRVTPELSLVKTRITDEQLLVAAPKLGELAIPLRRESDQAEAIEIDLFKKTGSAIDEGDEAAGYFSDYLGKQVRLRRAVRPRTIRADCQVPGYSTQTNFADGFPMLLTSRASLRELIKHSDSPITMNRFRPNIVVDGPRLEAYDEDYWREVRIGHMSAQIVRACARCPMPNVDQAEGVLPKPAGRFVSGVLEATRSGIDTVTDSQGEFFGQNVTHIPEEGLKLRVGDPVGVTERASQRNLILKD